MRAYLERIPWLAVMRPRQWIKNVVVLAAFFFAWGDKNQQVPFSALFTALGAAGAFILAAAGMYIFNDLRDRAADACHPVKRLRPIASGRIKPAPAAIWGGVNMAAGLLLGWRLAPVFGALLAFYVLLQLAYTFLFKHVHLVDVFIIAIGFVLRAVAGGLAIQAPISPWLLICTFLLALFLALCKRRYEMMLVENNAASVQIRPNLDANSTQLLDQLIAVTAGAVIIAYAIYTQWPETVEKFRTHYLYATVPFVVFGVFRYLDRVYIHQRGGEPENVLLTDWPLLIDILLFGASVIVITQL